VGDSDFSAKGGPLMALSSGDVVAADGGRPKVMSKEEEKGGVGGWIYVGALCWGRCAG